MSKTTLITVDLAKDVFQAAGFNDRLKSDFNNRLKRRKIAEFIAQQPPCELVMEACYSSHYWGRRFQEMGHTVRLLPAQHVTPFVRGNKSDRNDKKVGQYGSVRVGLRYRALAVESDGDLIRFWIGSHAAYDR